MTARRRAVVTGGASFLGSHLCLRLLADGYDVCCVDNLLTGCKENIAELAGTPGFDFIEADVTEALPVSPPVAVVAHLASPPVVHPQNEAYWGNVNTLGPRAVYSEANRYAEALTAYRRTFGTDTAIVRIFNTYGPRMRLGERYPRSSVRLSRAGLSQFYRDAWTTWVAGTDRIKACRTTAET